MAGPISSLRVVELAGLGPAPYCTMVLADLGADVIRVDRLDPAWSAVPPSEDLLNRGKRSIAADLKHPAGVEVVLRMVERSDVLVEGFRPGVVERLGLGPDICLDRNPRLVYGRMTGWGQDGALASRAGHDLNYLALSGVLSTIGTEERPIPPLNLVADFGGGGMLLAVGVLAAVIEARASGSGQVVDAAMVDGVAHLSTMLHAMAGAGAWVGRRRSNLLDGGAPFYDVYRTSDGGFVAVAALEPQFFAGLIEVLELDASDIGAQFDRSGWSDMRARFVEVFASRTRNEWEVLTADIDVCVTPVLGVAEAADHPHNRVRKTFVDVAGRVQPGPAPRFSATPTGSPGVPPTPGEHSTEILNELDYTEPEVDTLLERRVVR